MKTLMVKKCSACPACKDRDYDGGWCKLANRDFGWSDVWKEKNTKPPPDWCPLRVGDVLIKLDRKI